MGEIRSFLPFSVAPEKGASDKAGSANAKNPDFLAAAWYGSWTLIASKLVKASLYNTMFVPPVIIDLNKIPFAPAAMTSSPNTHEGGSMPS